MRSYESKSLKNGSMDYKNLIRKTVSSLQKINVKRENDLTTSSHTQDTAGGGRDMFLNTRGDAPLSILQQRHTANTQRNNDISATNTTTTTTTQKGGRNSSSNKKNGGGRITLRYPLTSNRKMQDAWSTDIDSMGFSKSTKDVRVTQLC